MSHNYLFLQMVPILLSRFEPNLPDSVHRQTAAHLQGRDLVGVQSLKIYYKTEHTIKQYYEFQKSSFEKYKTSRIQILEFTK